MFSSKTTTASSSSKETKEIKKSMLHEDFPSEAIIDKTSFNNLFLQPALSYNLCQYLSYHEIFFKVALFNKEFRNIVKMIEKYNQLWEPQLVFEFINPDDRIVDINGQKKDDINKYPQILNLIKEYLAENPQIKPQDIQLFEVLKYGSCKERKIRNYYKQLLDKSKDQKELTGKILTSKYLRPYHKRKQQGSICTSDDIPFEIYIYLRSNFYDQIDGVSLMEKMRYCQDVIVNYKNDFVFMKMNQKDFDIQWILFHPETMSAKRSWMEREWGESYDFIPIGQIRQQNEVIILYDYKNILGEGHTCLYITSLTRHYFYKIANSFQDWIKDKVDMLENELSITNKDGALTPWINMDIIYQEYIKKSFYHGTINEPHNSDQSKIVFQNAHKEYLNTSCTVKNGIQINIQSIFEPARSNIFPDHARMPKQNLFFYIQIQITTLPTFETEFGSAYELSEIIFDLNWEHSDQKKSMQIFFRESNKAHVKVFSTNQRCLLDGIITDPYHAVQEIQTSQPGVKVSGKAVFKYMGDLKDLKFPEDQSNLASEESDQCEKQGDIKDSRVGEAKDRMTIDINEFSLLLPEGKKFVKNPNDTEFWTNYDELIQNDQQ